MFKIARSDETIPLTAYMRGGWRTLNAQEIPGQRVADRFMDGMVLDAASSEFSRVRVLTFPRNLLGPTLARMVDRSNKILGYQQISEKYLSKLVYLRTARKPTSDARTAT